MCRLQATPLPTPQQQLGHAWSVQEDRLSRFGGPGRETNHPASVKECRRAFLHGWMVLQRHEGGNVPSRALSARFAAFLGLFFFSFFLFQFEAAAPRTPLAESCPACLWHAVISFHIQLFYSPSLSTRKVSSKAVRIPT